jgi:hypothetical protein
LYTGEQLSPNAYDLDHFLPWKFVLHDQLWNLIPVRATANSAKSDCLPAMGYLEGFVDLQTAAVLEFRTFASGQKWRTLVEPYVNDLKVSEDLLRDADATELKEQLRLVFHETVPPLLALAKQLGFRDNWEYKQSA